MMKMEAAAPTMSRSDSLKGQLLNIHRIFFYQSKPGSLVNIIYIEMPDV
jgi:hypothetical protein